MHTLIFVLSVNFSGQNLAKKPKKCVDLFDPYCEDTSKEYWERKRKNLTEFCKEWIHQQICCMTCKSKHALLVMMMRIMMMMMRRRIMI